jgi:hypothetical protein
VSSLTEALDDVEDNLEAADDDPPPADLLPAVAVDLADPYTDFAFRADSLEMELLLPSPPLLRVMPLRVLLVVVVSAAGMLTWTALVSAGPNFCSLQWRSSSRSFWQFSRSSAIMVDIFSISTFRDCCSRLKFEVNKSLGIF